MTLTNEERASAWLHANWPSHQVWSDDVASSLTALLAEVRAEERLDRALEVAKVAEPVGAAREPFISGGVAFERTGTPTKTGKAR
jgi:hypothetical protein